jgi:hypothetical protein
MEPLLAARNLKEVIIRKSQFSQLTILIFNKLTRAEATVLVTVLQISLIEKEKKQLLPRKTGKGKIKLFARHLSSIIIYMSYFRHFSEQATS